VHVGQDEVRRLDAVAAVGEFHGIALDAREYHKELTNYN
jgi:hypothetical protein